MDATGLPLLLITSSQYCPLHNPVASALCVPLSVPNKALWGASLLGWKMCRWHRTASPEKTAERFYLATVGHSHGYTTFLQASLGCHLYQSCVPYIFICPDLFCIFPKLFLHIVSPYTNKYATQYILVFSQTCFKIEVSASVLCNFTYVTLDHKTSLKFTFLEIEIYTSSES